MTLPFSTHIKVQRKQLLKVFVYAVEAFGLALLGTWLFAEGTSFFGKVVISAASAAVILVIGIVGVLLTSYSTLRDVEALKKSQDNGS
jgi:MFS-type transporter involved in bile tolerance (Atg22 family)